MALLSRSRFLCWPPRCRFSRVASCRCSVSGLHPGALGGILAFMLPMPAGVALWALGRGARKSPKASAAYRPSHGLMLFLGLAGIVVASPTMVLSWSRSGLFAFGVAALTLLGLRWHRLGRTVGPESDRDSHGGCGGGAGPIPLAGASG